MALMSYLSKDKHGTYYFRRFIPEDLRPLMPPPWTGKVQFKKSLRTKSPAAAKVAAAKALSECTAALQAAERAKRGEPAPQSDRKSLPALDAAEIESDTISAILAADEIERELGDSRRHLQTREERLKWPDLVPVSFDQKGMEPDHYTAYGNHLDELLGEYREALARRDPKIVDAELRTYLRKHALPIEPASDHYRQYGLAILRGHVRGYEQLQTVQTGGVVAPPVPRKAKGPKFSEAFAAWKAGGTATGSKKPGRNTVTEAEHAVRRFLEWHGDVRLGDIDKAKTREFRDALATLPTRLTKDLQKATIKDLMKRDLSAFPPVYASTVNKNLQLLSAIVSHAMREGKLDGLPNYANPFQGIKLNIDTRTAEGRDIFTASDLRAIFTTPVYKDGDRPAGGGGEAAFWLPLIALFTGARQSELAQLRICDLAQDPENAIWFFDIGTGGGRSIKTTSSRRKVPVHDQLAKTGLLQYRAMLVAEWCHPEWHRSSTMRSGSLWRMSRFSELKAAGTV